MDSTTDNALMAEVREGNLDKLGLLFERYHRRLFGFFYRMTSRRDVSEDLVQEVFERILKYRHTYTESGSFATWIFQIARNLQADHYHKNQRLDQEPQNDWDHIAGPYDSDIPEFETKQEREQRLLKKALDSLDPKKRKTLILSRYQGFKYKEIAEIMDCSVSAVKVRIFRAINELKEIVTELKQQEEQ